VPESVELVPDGQGNPPEDATGTAAEVNFRVGVVALVHAPVTFTGPFGAPVAVQVDKRRRTLATTPFLGMVSVPVGLLLLFAAQNRHLPFVSFAVTVAVPPMLLVHDVNVGGVGRSEQTGPLA
jgi:hypothetical protein